MLTIYSDDHHLHHGRCELIDGQLKPCFEMPSRADHVLSRVQTQNLGAIQAPKDFGLDPIARIHSRDYLDFFKGAWARWTQFNTDGDLLPYTWPARTLRAIKPTSLHGQLGYYSFDGGAPITAGTWQAAYSAAQVALTAQAEIQRGARSAFALCRPPGHHAAGDLMGGYCYLNNAAIAAQAFLDQGRRKVAILDVDYHHGNGTQDIFWEDGEVFFASIHADPRTDYPFYWGHADECGEGAGEGGVVPVGVRHQHMADGLALDRLQQGGQMRFVHRSRINHRNRRARRSAARIFRKARCRSGPKSTPCPSAPRKA